jgi:hypothetical protein
MRTKNIFLKASALALIMIFGCSEDLLYKVNPNELVADTYFKSEAELLSGVNAVYAAWQGLHLYGREYFFIHDLRGDDMQPGGSHLEPHRRAVIEGYNDPANGVAEAVWLGFYRVIHRANVVIESAAKPDVIASEEIVKRIVGEAKFNRAWAYFELVTLFGDVPLYTEYAKGPNDDKPRSPEADVYALIESDLIDAVAFLPESYPPSDVARANTYAARAMLARVYLQRNNHEEAKKQLDPIVNSNEFSLVDDYIDNFTEENEFNEESIFEVSFTTAFGGFSWNPTGDNQNMEATVRGQEYSPIGWRNLIPSNGLLAEYEAGDSRFAHSSYQIGDLYNNDVDTIKEMHGVTPFISWRKYAMAYKVNNEAMNSGINFRVIRYPEVLLMLAECENELDNRPRAIELMNIVRQRPSVSLPDYPTTDYPCDSKEEVFKAMVHEKRVELAGEQIRNRDILRWRKFNKLTSEPISYYASKHAYLPIPNSEITNNTKLSNADQNSGY